MHEEWERKCPSNGGGEGRELFQELLWKREICLEFRK
jgi:hypothetical protein